MSAPSVEDAVRLLRGAVGDIGPDYFSENPGAVVDLMADNFPGLRLADCRLLAVRACRELGMPEPRS